MGPSRYEVEKIRHGARECLPLPSLSIFTPPQKLKIFGAAVKSKGRGEEDIYKLGDHLKTGGMPIFCASSNTQRWIMTFLVVGCWPSVSRSQ